MKKIIILALLLTASVLYAATYFVALNKPVTVTRTDTSTVYPITDEYGAISVTTKGSDSLQIIYAVDKAYKALGGSYTYTQVKLDTVASGEIYGTYILRAGATDNYPAADGFRVRCTASVVGDSAASMGYSVKYRGY